MNPPADSITLLLRRFATGEPRAAEQLLPLVYEELRALFEDNLDRDVPLFKEFHGLIVWTGKDFCRTHPRCEGCPLAATLPGGTPLLYSCGLARRFSL